MMLLHEGFSCWKWVRLEEKGVGQQRRMKKEVGRGRKKKGRRKRKKEKGKEDREKKKEKIKVFGKNS